MNIIFSLFILIINSMQISTVAAKAELAKIITVHNKGPGDFENVQEAIDSIPAGNNKWIKIRIKAGLYLEKVRIPKGKGYLMLEGDGADITLISWSDHDPNVLLYNHRTNRYKGTVYRYSKRYNLAADKNDSATLAVWAENVVLKDLSIRNNYGEGHYQGKAVAATLAADKIAAYGCKFIGIQDTLCDLYDRHYFKQCHIEGAVDFIWGFGQSLYEDCNIRTVGSGLDNFVGWVTAHGRSEDDSSGFVFKDCFLGGTVKTHLGRAWQPLARVIFYRTYMSSVVVPRGWDNKFFNEELITFVEANNSGPGASLNGRVNWLKHISSSELHSFVDGSFVDDGWINQQPI